MARKKKLTIARCTPEECQDIARAASSARPILADDGQLAARARLFKALGNETRLKILGLLMVQEMCICDLVLALDGAASTIIHHLHMLEEAGLITSRREGKFSLYRLNEEPLVEHRVFQ